jgi:hypothetical protein
MIGHEPQGPRLKASESRYRILMANQNEKKTIPNATMLSTNKKLNRTGPWVLGRRDSQGSQPSTRINIPQSPRTASSSAFIPVSNHNPQFW